MIFRKYAIASILLAASLVSGCKRPDGVSKVAAHAPSIDTTVGHAPAGVRIKVEVLNASGNHGSARRATLFLRSRGYDVVGMGNTGRNQDETVVLDRSNHPEWARLIATAIGGRAQERPDTLRYLDATVVIGAKWTPPPMPFYP